MRHKNLLEKAIITLYPAVGRSQVKNLKRIIYITNQGLLSCVTVSARLASWLGQSVMLASQL